MSLSCPSASRSIPSSLLATGFLPAGAGKFPAVSHGPANQQLKLGDDASSLDAQKTDRSSAGAGPPEDRLRDLRQAALVCQACDLWNHATQTVFGEGPVDAALVLVGEQPGDQEDLAGRPFVGPAGRVLDEALEAAGVDRTEVYVTNAVKHFKWKPSGKRRLHDKPNRQEVDACRPWLSRELELVRPEVLVVLGATAAQALLGSSFRLTHHRQEVITDTGFAPQLLATAHPSVILRLPDATAREQARRQLAEDLTLAVQLLGAGK
jgi:uracil-DNA glycosylase family protein